MPRQAQTPRSSGPGHEIRLGDYGDAVAQAEEIRGMVEMPQSSPREPAARSGWWLLAIVCCLAYLHASAPVSSNDLFWQIKTGEHLVQVGEFPERDVFSYTADRQDWHVNEWLSHVLFFGLHQVGGFPVLRLLTGLMAVAILLMVFHLARREIGHSLPAALVVMAFALLGTARLQTHPSLFTMALLLWLIIWLTRQPATWQLRHAMGMVALVVVWVNLHSVGLLALVVYGAFLVALALKWFLQWQGPVPGWEHANGKNLVRHALTWIAACGASVCNPSGFQLYALAFRDESRVMKYITDDWDRFRLAYGANESLTPEAYGILLASLVVMLVVYVLTRIAVERSTGRVASPSMPDPALLAVALVCLVLGLMARRFHWMVAVALLFALGLLAQHLRSGQFTALARVLGSRGARGLCTALVIAMLGLLYNRELRHEGELLHRAASRPEFYQRQVVQSLDLPAIQFLADAGLEGNIFCDYASGGMVSFHLYPAIKVFIDSRVDLYPREVFLDYLTIRAGRPDQIELLDRYDTDIFYRQPGVAPLVNTKGWIPIYSGMDGELWLRAGHGWRNLERSANYYTERGIPFDRYDGVY
jgi:hypothetical protein